MAKTVKRTNKHGYAFEAEIAEILRNSGFVVTSNPKVAKPRQTDLFAKSEDIDLLVEAKNRTRNVSVADIDDLRVRLRRTSSDIVGVIFTTSRLTSGAIKAIEEDRSREILAFVKRELEGISSKEHSFHTLLERKRDELRANGKAWFGTANSLEFANTPLPASTTEFQFADSTKAYFESSGDFGGLFYTLQMHDTGWGNIGGEGARLNLRLALNTAADLRNIVGYLHQKFGLSRNGSFSIQQSSSCWHGIGINNFLRSVEQWRDRYSKSLFKDFHHSEELNYFDQFRNGWIEFSSEHRIDFDQSDHASFLYGAQLVIQFSGVPVDTTQYRQLCKYTGNDWANFQFVPERLSFMRRLKRPLPLETVGKVLSRDDVTRRRAGADHTVIGIVARNPFYNRKQLPEELLDPELPALDGLVSAELLLCSLSDWYNRSDQVDHHFLKGFEITVGGAGNIVRPYGSWNELIKES